MICRIIVGKGHQAKPPKNINKNISKGAYSTSQTAMHWVCNAWQRQRPRLRMGCTVPHVCTGQVPPATPPGRPPASLHRLLPYHTIPYHTTPYHTIPYHTIPYHAGTFLGWLTSLRLGSVVVGPCGVLSPEHTVAHGLDWQQFPVASTTNVGVALAKPLQGGVSHVAGGGHASLKLGIHCFGASAHHCFTIVSIIYLTIVSIPQLYTSIIYLNYIPQLYISPLFQYLNQFQQQFQNCRIYIWRKTSRK